MLRILHTSDWHIGHSLHDVSREAEHDSFLAWLLHTLKDEQIDALLIAGDIFDTSNPSAIAQQQWYRFLHRAKNQQPSLDIIAIAGNHDSSGRLEAPRPLLEEMNIQIVGRLPASLSNSLSNNELNQPDLDRSIVPLRDAKGEVAAWCVPVPFLRPCDLPRTGEDADSTLEGVRTVHRTLLDAAVARCTPEQAVVAMGHCYLKSATPSEQSERRTFVGNEQELPADIYEGSTPNSVSYVALGHLHLGQKVAGLSHIRYSGSPIPLSMDEMRYKHHVCVVTLDGKQLVDVKEVPIPRSIGMLRIPESGPKPWDEVQTALAALPAETFLLAQGEPKPYLEVRVSLDKPDSDLRKNVADAIKGKHVRLIKLTVERTGSGMGLGSQLAGKQLQDLTVEEVFLRCYQSKHDGLPTSEIMSCFRDLVDAVEKEEIA